MVSDRNDLIFKPTKLILGSNNTGDISLNQSQIRITIRTVTMSVESIHIEDETLANYLATDANPSTPYTPQYPGSPATKKYVDDSISTAVASAYKYKGSVATYSSLPSSGNTAGDVWNVTDTDMNYAWTGSDWDQLGSTVDLSNYLAKNNTTAFTPTGDYNPATKKYVDDSVSANNWIEVNVATAYGTAAKVGTTTAGDYTPTKGDFLLVNFVGGCNVDNPTLNIDGSGAKAIRTGSANATKSTFTLGTTANSNIKALFYYDGTYYRCWSTTNSNTTYSAMSVAEGQTGTATSSRAMTAANLKSIIKYHAVDNSRLSDDWYSGTAIAPSQASIYYEFAKRDIQAGTDLEIVGISSHNLPQGYTELSFLGGSGSGYINTGNIIQCNDTVKIKFRRTTATTPSGTQSFFGSIQGSSSVPRSNIGFRTNGYLFGGVNQTVDYAPIDTNIHTIEQGYDGVDYYYKYDNGAKTTYTPTSTTDPSINAYLFARNGSTVIYSGGVRIYYLEWYREDGTEVAHLIPAQRDDDGILGMYDLVSDTFLAPAGSGTWSGEPLGNVINFTNDSGYITSSYHDSTKQDTLVSGTNIKTVNNESLLGTGNITISAPTYTAGENITIDQNNEISAVDTTYTAGEGILIGAVHSDMQGPCPDGFHIPTVAEWVGIKNIMSTNALYISDYLTDVDSMSTLHLPKAGYRDGDTGTVNSAGTSGEYWTVDGEVSGSYVLCKSHNIFEWWEMGQDNYYANSIRPFKDEFVAPTNSWTVVRGTLGGAGVFWNQTDGLITITDGTTGYTIADKNLGATTVYNNGDTLSQANCGNFFQRGNNYGFPWTGSVTTSSTQVDASSYGPGNYYSSSTFITSDPWDSSLNLNLWGGVSKGTWIDSNGTTIANIGVLSVNGQTGNVTLPVAEIGLSTATGNLLTPGAKIWVGDESNLPATQDSNTVYLCAEQTSGTPRLPAAYQEVEYIESGVNGDSQYIQFNLPQFGNGDYSVEIDVSNIGFAEGDLLVMNQSVN